MESTEWTKEFPAVIEICDKEGNLLYLNDKGAVHYQKEGGEKLIGTNILSCHPGQSRVKLEGMLQQQLTSCHIIEKNGKRTFVYQAPWYKDKEYKGIAEILIDLPVELVIKKRD